MRTAFLFVLCSLLAGSAIAQQPRAEARVKALVPYETLKAQIPELTLEQYNAAVSKVAQAYSSPGTTSPAPSASSKPQYLGQLSSNPYAPQSTSNSFGTYGSPYSPESVNNPYGRYGSPYGSNSAKNPYATSTPKLFARDGQYLGKVSSNPYDPESVSNPYGRHGSPYSPTSINNPYGKYGSPYSPLSPSNPYSTQAPVIIHKK